MKNATEYGNKFLKQLPKIQKDCPGKAHPDGLDMLESFVLAVLRQDACLDDAVAGLETLKKEFIDYNELRVAPPRDIVELLSDNIPDRRGKARQITSGLNLIFDHGNQLDFEHVAELGKRELRTHLRDALGFNSFVEAYMMLHVFDARAIPVDNSLTERLKADKLVHEESDCDDVRSMLERVIAAKDASEVYGQLAEYATRKEPEAPADAEEKTSAPKSAKTSKKSSKKKASKKTTTKKAASKSAKKTTAKTAKKTTKKAAKSAKK